MNRDLLDIAYQAGELTMLLSLRQHTEHDAQLLESTLRSFYNRLRAFEQTTKSIAERVPPTSQAKPNRHKGNKKSQPPTKPRATLALAAAPKHHLIFDAIAALQATGPLMGSDTSAGEAYHKRVSKSYAADSKRRAGLGERLLMSAERFRILEGLSQNTSQFHLVRAQTDQSLAMSRLTSTAASTVNDHCVPTTLTRMSKSKFEDEYGQDPLYANFYQNLRQYVLNALQQLPASAGDQVSAQPKPMDVIFDSDQLKLSITMTLRRTSYDMTTSTVRLTSSRASSGIGSDVLLAPAEPEDSEYPFWLGRVQQLVKVRAKLRGAKRYESIDTVFVSFYAYEAKFSSPLRHDIFGHAVLKQGGKTVPDTACVSPRSILLPVHLMPVFSIGKAPRPFCSSMYPDAESYEYFSLNMYATTEPGHADVCRHADHALYHLRRRSSLPHLEWLQTLSFSILDRRSYSDLSVPAPALALALNRTVATVEPNGATTSDNNGRRQHAHLEDDDEAAEPNDGARPDDVDYDDIETDHESLLGHADGKNDVI